MADNNMLRPSINQIIKKGESPYMLVIAVAKRARTIADDLVAQERILMEKPVKTAVTEFYEHKYKFITK
jgi:DNA-directed RNA polymerase subunit omega